MKARQHAVAVASVLWTVGMIASYLAPSIPPGLLPALLVLAAVALVPAVLGTPRVQAAGAVAVLLSLSAAYAEHQSGLAWAAQHPQAEGAVSAR